MRRPMKWSKKIVHSRLEFRLETLTLTLIALIGSGSGTRMKLVLRYKGVYWPRKPALFERYSTQRVNFAMLDSFECPKKLKSLLDLLYLPV